MMEVSTNASVGTSDLEDNGIPLRTVLITLQSLILIFSSVGNVVVLSMLYMYKRRKKKLVRIYIFIMHLCMADLAVATFNVAPYLCFIVSYPEPCFLQTSSSACKATQYLTIVSIYGSTYVLLVTAIDRFIIVKFPFWNSRITDRHAHLMVAVAWVISFAFSMPQIFIFKYDTDDRQCISSWSDDLAKHVLHENLYIAWFASAVWILPTILMSVCYITITHVIISHSKILKQSGRGRSIHQQVGQVDVKRSIHKSVKLTLAVVVGYILCWSPYMLAIMIIQYGDIKTSK